tara:strand:- start:827 stop:1084 length:258 start_codon:yes stop_codon:yes gene_type:complete
MENGNTDLLYTQNGMFTRFTPNTEAGETALLDIYKITGDGAVRNDHLKSTLRQLRKAGYKVSKAKKVTDKEMKVVFEELDKLLND